ncbi:MAG: hypothetical protein A3G34_10505 [Candidatus Lindowbacteria bacterium RIFCSPLOWO2_12_FULL_62_27]|nr:MAG: hypothetical protein A3G34_10505 [Candidatus Lindowbacteria bacterium RIFCSPLOWO2_12_FULL_62_27]
MKTTELMEKMVDKIEFFTQDVGALKDMRGERLYFELNRVGATYGEYFKVTGSNIRDYCRDQFKIDLPNCTIEKFFSSDPNAKWLFPDIVREGVLSGLRHRPIHNRLVASEETAEGNSYQVPYVDEKENEAEEEALDVAEGADIPESEIKYGDRIVVIGKKGRGIIASYEAMRRMKINMLRVHLERVGQRVGIQLDNRCGEVLRVGNSTESAPTAIPVITPGALVYEDLTMGFVELMDNRNFTPTNILCSATTKRKILNMAEFKDPLVFDFARTGKTPSPLGLTLDALRNQPDNQVTILDKAFAVVKVTENDVTVESDKLISKQWDRSYITLNVDFAILYKDARVVIQI